MVKEIQLTNIADELRKEADDIIFNRGLDPILKDYGKVSYTGSYFLDVMAWPDLDIHIVLEPDPYSFDTFFELGRRIAQLKGVWSLHFHNLILHRVEELPKGLYCGIRMDRVNSERCWKIDLWGFDQHQFEEDKVEMNRMLQAMDPSKRKLILKIKHSLLTPDERTPILSGYHIYQAVLFEDLVKREDIVRYLQKQGVNLG